ncbi:unnamed protein product [Lathyrus oleraceus]
MKGRSSIIIFILIVCLISLLVKYRSSFSEEKTYIIYTGNTRNNETSLLQQYKKLCLNFSGEEPKIILQYYKKSFSRFVANLTKEEANKMAGHLKKREREMVHGWMDGCCWCKHDR